MEGYLSLISPLTLISILASIFINSNLESEQIQSIAALNDLIDLHNADNNHHYILAGHMNLFFYTCLDILGGNPALKNKSLSAIINLLEKLDVCE